jgi:hypothetical protein
MNPKLKKALRSDFDLFLHKAHGKKLADPYVSHLTHALTKVANGETRRLVINLPPRHGKTFTSSIALPAFILGHNPAAKILIVTYGENLAVEIARGIRAILRATWYRAVFDTRLAIDHARASDFATTAGGAVYAQPIGGQITGYGADIIIIDDPLEIKDADNITRIQFVNRRFDELIRNRFDYPSHGAILIVAHRLNEDDLCGARTG